MSLTGPRRTLTVLVVAAVAGAVFAGWLMSRQSDPSQSQRLELQARLALRSHRLAEAQERLDQLAAIRQPTSEDRMLLAELASAQKREEHALSQLSAIPDSDPVAPRARVLTGQIERKQNRLKPAEQEFLNALKLDPELDSARRGLIFLYGMQSRRTELDAQFQILARRGDLSFQDMLVWTLALEDIWINTGVQADLERYVAADPDDRYSRLALADVLLRSGQLDASDSVISGLSESDPDALAIRARLAWNRSDLAAVTSHLEQAPRDHAGLARLRGQLAIRLDQPEEAIDAFRTAIQLEPSSQEALQGLALALRRTGAQQEADVISGRAERQRALTSLLELCRSEKTRDDPTLPLRLAAACEAIGRDDIARGWYRAALAKDPTNAQLQRDLHRLRQKNEPLSDGT